MAKGNMLQGMARGKVGDVVFSRLDGQQIARVRNRNPKNPRTNSQLYQRAIMATVMQAYAAGKEIFDHSFEGYKVGAANQRHFLSINAKKLRKVLADEISAKTSVDKQVGRVIAPGVKTPVPFKYTISEGSLPSLTDANGKLPITTGEETVAQYCTRVGIVPGDILTVVGFGIPNTSNTVFALENSSDNYSKQYACNFGALRIEAKADILTSETKLSKIGDIFEVSKVINCKTPDLSDSRIDDFLGLMFMQLSDDIGSCGVIRSRKDSDLRSTTEMNYGSGGTEFGLATQYALAAWKQGTVLVGDSDLILEGGDSGNVL